jgi:TetR/AcrR family transcriptional regulator
MNIDPQTPTARGPGRPRQSESEKADVRERLLDAATELAVEQGFEACGLREIAARAEVSPAMISYYFGDRDGLYEAMFGRAFERISEKVAAVMADPLRSGRDRIDDLVAIQVKAIAADPWLPKLVMREVLARNGSPMQEFVSDAVAKGPLQMMVDWIEEEQERHEIRSDYDPRMLAMTIASLTGFPFLMLPLVGDRLGLELDDEFPDRLIAHNQKLLSNALRAHTEEK